MSFFKKVLSSVGIGSAKVDTVLNTEHFMPGGEIEGTIYIQGGSTEQKIDSIYLSVVTNYQEEYEYESEVDGETQEGEVRKTVTLQNIQLKDAFVINADENLEIPLNFQLPFDTPLTLGKTQVWLKTSLDIDNAIDPSDRDYLKIIPNKMTEILFNSIHSLGFELYEAESTAMPASMRRRLPFVQEFEFKPLSGPFHSKLDELEVIILVTEDNIEVMLEIDRKARGFSGFLSEMLDSDESLVRFTYSEETVEELTEHLYDIIDNFS